MSTILIVLLMSISTFAQNDQKGFYVGYEILEMAMNKFQYFAGEIGYRFDKKNHIRLAILEVKLTERHLSSSTEAYAVDGENVEGYFRGYEINYDKFYYKNLFISANMGYFHDTYEHTILDEKVENKTFTIGTALGYRHSDLFGIKHFYINFSLPVRYYFNKLEETKLGDTTVREHSIVNNIWLFLGYQF